MAEKWRKAVAVSLLLTGTIALLWWCTDVEEPGPGTIPPVAGDLTKPARNPEKTTRNLMPENYKVLKISVGFTLSDQPAMSIWFGENDDHVFQWTLLREDARQLKTGEIYASKLGSEWRRFDLDRYWGAAHCIQSGNHDTFFQISVDAFERGRRNGRFGLEGRCVDARDLSTLHDFRGLFTVSGDDFDVMVN